MKRKGRYFWAVAMAAVCTFIPGLAFADEVLSQAEIDTTAGEYLESMANLMVADTPENEAAALERAKNSITDSSFQSDLRERISKWKEQLAENGLTYKAARSDLAVESQNIGSDGRLYVRATESTMLTIAGEEVEEGMASEHIFVYENVDGAWLLVEDEQVEPSGLLPEEGKSEYSIINEEGELEILTNESASLDEGQLEEIEGLDNQLEILPQAVTPTGYNPLKAAAYLEKYYRTYNPAYRSFKGKDCTNFASQALRAGGWTFKTGYSGNANFWWYTKKSQSKSWINVEYLGSFAKLSHRCQMLKSPSQLRLGDMLQVKPKGSKQKTHTMMVSYVKNGVPHFTYHSSDKLRVPLSKILSRYPGATFYCYDIQ